MRCGPMSASGSSSAADLPGGEGEVSCRLRLATLFLQAQKLGFTVLTANIADFDYLLQLVPTGRVLFYRIEKRVASPQL